MASLPADKLDLDDDGDTTEPIPRDVVGNPRVVGDDVDIGAYEVQPDIVTHPVPAGQVGERAYYSPEETAQRKALWEGRLVGLGIGLEASQDGMLIKRVWPDSGAEKAGLEAGQIILRIDGRPVAGMSAPDAAKRLRGPAGTTVTLELRTGSGSTRSVVVTRTNVVITGVESRLLADGIGFLRVEMFTKETSSRIRAALEELSARRVRGIVLDLREGAGGRQKYVVEVMELFVGPGRTLFYKQKQDGTLQALKSQEEALTDLPMVVLIDAKTGGELVAAALKRTRRATLVGRSTPGATAVRESVDHPDGSSDTVVRGKFFMGRGLPITGEGVEPDVVTPADATPDEMLDRAIALLKAKIND